MLSVIEPIIVLIVAWEIVLSWLVDESPSPGGALLRVVEGVSLGVFNELREQMGGRGSSRICGS